MGSGGYSLMGRLLDCLCRMNWLRTVFRQAEVVGSLADWTLCERPGKMMCVPSLRLGSAAAAHAGGVRGSRAPESSSTGTALFTGAKALAAGGSKVERGSFPGEGLQGHAEINRRLGDPAYPATGVVDGWLLARFTQR